MNYHLFGDRYVEVPNERDALDINYYLKSADASSARVTITDIAGKPVAQLSGPGRAGLNCVEWTMLTMPAGATAASAGCGQTGGGRGGGGRGGNVGAPAPVGDYIVTLEIGGEKLTKIGRIRERIR
jgi:hypothetical protein